MTTTSQPRPLRADAQRNHDRIVIAAGEAFAELGLEVSMEEIARRAGVGPATLYRRFSSKQALLRAIFEAGLAKLEPTLAAAEAHDDAWEGLLAGMSALLDAQAANMALVQVLAAAGQLTLLKDELRARVFEPLGALFARAQASGQVRADLDPKELHLLIRMVSCTTEQDDAGASRANWRRYLTLLADALRTPTPTRLPPA
ncbi:MAG: helix-turn-helix domain-containing protein [Solirubrobacteraceae bacterium]|jgi:AcrR family transcriptional regulator